MPHHVNYLAREFGLEVTKALELIDAAERVRTSNPNAIARRDFSVPRLELVYELAYLRIFIFWEQFLEESLVRYLCGYVNSHGRQVLRSGAFERRIDDARSRIRGNWQFLLWHDPQKVTDRAKRHINGGLHETIVQSNFTELQHLAYIRHRIAHMQEDGRQKFDQASMSLCGRRFKGARPGKLLRHKASATERWIEKLGMNLLNLANQITP